MEALRCAGVRLIVQEQRDRGSKGLRVSSGDNEWGAASQGLRSV